MKSKVYIIWNNTIYILNSTNVWTDCSDYSLHRFPPELKLSHPTQHMSSEDLKEEKDNLYTILHSA